MKIQISKPTEQELEKLNVRSWPVWEKEVSRFPWKYDSLEICYIIEGDIIVETSLETVHILPGDLVTFPAGLSCVWDIRKDVRKHYIFPD
jgi:uncharacterized protein